MIHEEPVQFSALQCRSIPVSKAEGLELLLKLVVSRDSGTYQSTVKHYEDERGERRIIFCYLIYLIAILPWRTDQMLSVYLLQEGTKCSRPSTRPFHTQLLRQSVPAAASLGQNGNTHGVQ